MSRQAEILARDALAGGNVEVVIELWGSVRSDPLTPDDLFHWLLMLVEAGAAGEAPELAARLSGSDYEERAKALLAEEDREFTESEDDDVIDESVLRGPAPASDARVVGLLLRWFGGRGDVHARQWWNEPRRRGGYRLVEEPLTPQVARQHLNGTATVGQYLLFPDETCACGVIDLDLASSALSELRAGAGELVTPAAHSGLREYSLKLISTARGLGIPLWPEDSGSRGLHLWLFLNPRRPARAVRAVLGQVVAAAGGQPSEVGVEIFPKQDRLGPRGLSSLVKLPLGLHQATLRRCALLDDDLVPIADPVVALERLEAVSPETMSDTLGRRLLAPPDPELAGPVPALSHDTSPRTLAEALRAIEPGKPEREACEQILAGCAVLRRIVARAYDERRLEPAFARALCYTLGLVGPGPGLVDELFAVVGASRKELERVRVGMPSPTGCKRLRRLELAEKGECPCTISEAALPYATPTLFAVGEQPPAPPSWKPFAAWLEDLPDWSGDLLGELVERLRRIDRRLGELESK